MLGDADATGWAYAEVGAVNRFHNDFVGTSEYMSSENGIAYCERGDSGVVLVNCNGTYTNVNVSAHTMKNGTYIDQVSGDKGQVAAAGAPHRGVDQKLHNAGNGPDQADGEKSLCSGGQI